MFQKIWIIICFAPKLSFSHQKLCSRFLCLKFFISADCCEAWKFTDFQKLATLMQPELFHFQVFICIFEKSEEHMIRKSFSKVHGSSVFYSVGKKCLCQMLLSFSKMKVLLWHHYRVIHSMKICFVLLDLFMYISIIL